MNKLYHANWDILVKACRINDIIIVMITNISNTLANFLKKILHKLSQNLIKVIIGVGVLGYILYKVFSPSQIVDETAKAEIGNLKQYVEVSGSVQASRDAKLSFQTLGTVSYVGVKVGDVVPQGKVLATLQGGDAQANLLQAQAQLQSAQATLEQLTQGSRKEEIAVKQQAVDNAKNSLDQSYTSLPDTIRNVDAITADIVKNKLSNLFISSGDRFTLSFSSCDQGLQSTIETNRSKIEKTLVDYQKKSSSISALSSTNDIDSAFDQAYVVTVETNSLVNSISNLLLSSCSTQNTSLDAFRTTLSTVRTTMNTLFADITTKRSTLNTAKNLLSQTTRDLDLSKAGTDPYKIKAQAAAVSQAEASVASAESGINKTIITAPFKGTISDVAVTQGETVSGGNPVISMLAVDAFEIEAKVPEVDVVKIKTGASVDVTLDAYGKGAVFPATVTRVNPTATTEGGVPMYKVIITFIGSDERIKSGMTANVKIITENKTSVLMLPSRFVEVKNGTHGSVVLKSDVTVKRDVTLGSRGQNGMIEILSGLVSGDEVVAPTTGTRSAQKQTQ